MSSSAARIVAPPPSALTIPAVRTAATISHTPPALAMIIVVRRSRHRKKFTEPVALSSTQPADLPLPRRASRLSFDLLALRARCVEEPMGKARLGQAPANRIGAVCALLRVEKLCVERVPSISGIAERVICARARGPLATGSDPHPHHPPARNDIGPGRGGRSRFEAGTLHLRKHCYSGLSSSRKRTGA